METKQRLSILIYVVVALFALVIVRLIDLQVLRHRFFLEKSAEQRKRIINLTASRGDIYDRNGKVLATSVDTYSVFTSQPHFSFVAKKLPLAEAEKLKSQRPGGYFLLKEKKRVYPKADFAAQTIGFVGADNQGLSGIELSWDKYLRGKAGKIVTEGDPDGKEMYGALRELEPGENGFNVTLTIDENIQYIAEREIAEQVKRSSAVSGTLIVVNAKTGEILALASKPDFDPNQFAKTDRKLWHPRVLDPYEPGSTFKVITAACGLDDGAITIDSKLKALDQIEVGGKIIANSHQIHWQGKEVSISFMLEQSINTAVAQIGLKLGPEKFYNNIRRFGFGTAIDFGLEGESRGIVRRWENWYKPDAAMITFGQSIAVTPLQLVSAFSAFANKGKIIRPYLVKKIESLDGKFLKTFAEEERGRAVSPKTALEVKQLLRNVVLKGSGRRAKMDWFAVGGKTGTAQKAIPGGRGYLKGHYIASFIGLAPLDDPKLLALVIVDDPKGSIWGESVCGPVFKNVVEYALRYLNVRPDADIMAQQ